MKAIYATLAIIGLSLATLRADEKTTVTRTTTEDGVTTTTQQTTTSMGTLTEYSPGATFIVKETSGPVTYSYGKDVVYATKSGRILTPDEVHTRIRVGLPVNVHYINRGDTRIVNRVIIDD